MPKLFQVTCPDGQATLQLNSQGRATVQYAVKNVSAREIDGRVVLVSVPKKSAGVVEKGWIQLEGKSDRHFGADQQETFVVKVGVPPGSPKGDYAFRLDAVSVTHTDEGDQGQVVGFTVPETIEITKPPVRWWIPAVVLGLVLVGVVSWVLWPKGIKVPDLKGKSRAEAATTLTAANLTLDQNVESVDAPDAEAGKVVSQTPAADAKVPEGTAVHVALGAPKGKAPVVISNQRAEKLASDWLAAMLSHDVPKLLELADMPFYFDKEVLVRSDDLRDRLQKLFVAKPSVLSGFQIQSIRGKTISEMKKEGVDTQRDRVLASLNLSDEDYGIAVFVSTDQNRNPQGMMFFTRRTDTDLKLAGMWD